MWNIFTSSSEVGLRLRIKLATPEKCSNCTKNGEIWQFIAEIGALSIKSDFACFCFGDDSTNLAVILTLYLSLSTG